MSYYSFDGQTSWSVPDATDGPEGEVVCECEDRGFARCRCGFEAQSEDDQQLQEQAQIIHRINTSDILRDLSLRLEDEPLSSPIVQAAELWLSEPQPDWGRLLASPASCERVGRHVLGLLASVVERHVMMAMQAAKEGRA